MNTKVCSVTSKPTQGSSRCVSSLEDSSVLYVYVYIWIGFDTGTLMSLPTFLSYLFTCVHNTITQPVFLPFLNASSVQNGRKQKFTNQNTEMGILHNGFAKL